MKLMWLPQRVVEVRVISRVSSTTSDPKLDDSGISVMMVSQSLSHFGLMSGSIVNQPQHRVVGRVT